MKRAEVLARLKALSKSLGSPPGWKAVGHAKLTAHILRHWDYLSDALDEALGTGWRKASPELARDEEAIAEEPAPAGQPYSVYVIKLKKAVSKDKRFRSKNPLWGTKGCVYVGQTWHPPSVRFKQHMIGVRSGRFVRRFGVRLINEFTDPKRNKFATRAAALKEEARFAEELRRDGYRVWQQ